MEQVYSSGNDFIQPTEIAFVIHIVTVTAQFF